MYADNTLTPKEAVRFCALGTLAAGPLSYSKLAISVRHFIDRVQGPSLDVLGTSIELLKYEGLVTAADTDDGETIMQITEKGLQELTSLLTANIRASGSDHNKLIEALKFRYLHLLETSEQHTQAEVLTERADIELGRLLDLRDYYQSDPGHLIDWLDQQISELRTRLVWLETFRKSI